MDHGHSGEASSTPTLVESAAPRPLRPEEARLARYVVERSGVEELTRQLDSAQVRSECSCGCPSVGIESAGPLVPPSVMSLLSHDGRTGWAELSAWGTDDTGRRVEVNLHVVEGRLFELEVWAGWDGTSPVTSLPELHTMTTGP